MDLKQRIRDAYDASRETLGKIALFVVGWIVTFDTIAGTFIPIAYGKSCAWFAIPNLIIDIYVITILVRRVKDENTH